MQKLFDGWKVQIIPIADGNGGSVGYAKRLHGATGTLRYNGDKARIVFDAPVDTGGGSVMDSVEYRGDSREIIFI
jgi:hypothetical protein